MAKAYVTLAPVGVKDVNGAPIPLLRGRPVKDAEVAVTGVTGKLNGFVVPDDAAGIYSRYCWVVTAVDAAMKVVAGKDPNATTGIGYRLVAGDRIEIVAEEVGETLALVTI